MKKQIRIVIADDHEVWRKGMVEILNSLTGVRVIAEAENGLELLQLTEKWQPDVIITDIKMPGLDGISAIRSLTRSSSAMQPVVIAMSMIEEEMEIYDVLAGGAKGYLVKNAKRHEIQQAIEAVLNSDGYYCSFENPHLAKLVKANTYPNLPPQHHQFTNREMEVMEGLSKQLTSEQIGEKLFISTQTVNGHRNNLLKKTGAKNVIGLILYGIRNRLIKWPHD